MARPRSPATRSRPNRSSTKTLPRRRATIPRSRRSGRDHRCPSSATSRGSDGSCPICAEPASSAWMSRTAPSSATRRSASSARRCSGGGSKRRPRVGKWLSIDVGDVALVVHFGMTGSLRRAAPSTAPEPSDRVAIGTSRGELRFRDPRRLGRWALLRPTADPSTVTGPFGPDALSLANGQLRALLHGSRGAVKSALMGQTRIAGIGNFLSDEICWRAGVHPARRADLLGDGEWAALQRALRSVLHAVARAGHTPRGPRWLTGARWSEDRRCPACGTPLADSRIGGRHACWCPRCQPPPHAPSSGRRL